MRWLTETDEGARLVLRIQPRASRTEIAGPQDDALRIRISSPPVDGAANRELVAFLAKRLRRPKSSIRLLRGHRGRVKTLLIEGMDARSVRSALEIP